MVALLINCSFMVSPNPSAICFKVAGKQDVVLFFVSKEKTRHRENSKMDGYNWDIYFYP